MAYVALYRKYRSQSFDELMGQEAVTTILRNSIASRRFAHAYLFYGARGCGKTSTARLLARALNCVAKEGPNPDPCGVCRLCTAIRDGICLDVIEMDAASETGIDDVREKVIENVQYAPGEARYKVYIIDEVHDLSAKAFDALLKTLEEPPPHVVFVLATTEYHKVPITIRSRCQSFQFKRGTLKDLSASVERVVKAEGYSAEPEAIEAVARSAEGSWRDALSILEQVLAYSEGHITAETVHRAVGTVGAQELARVTETLANGDTAAAIDIAAELLERGTDVRQLLAALQGHLRHLMLLASGAKQASQEMGPDRLALLQPQAKLFSTPALLRMSGELFAAERELRTNNQHRWILERTLALLQAIGQGGVALAPTVSSPGLVVNGRASEKSPSQSAAGALPPTTTPTVVPKPQVTIRGEATPIEIEKVEEEPESEVESPVVASIDSPIKTDESSQKPDPEPVVVANDPRFAEEVTLEVIQRAWPRIKKLVEQVSKPAYGFLEKAEVAALEGLIVQLRFRESFAQERIQAKGKDLVEKALNRGLKTEGYKILCILDRPGSGGNGGTTSAPKTPVSGPSDGATAFTGSLLEAPETPAPRQTRVMDIDLPAAPLQTEYKNESSNGSTVGNSTAPPEADNVTSSRSTDAAATHAATVQPESSGMLAETLDIFGGEVIKSEPIR